MLAGKSKVHIAFVGFGLLIALSFLSSCGLKSGSENTAEAADSTVVTKAEAGKYCNEKYQFCIRYFEDNFTTDTHNAEGIVLISTDSLAQLKAHRGNLDASIKGGVSELKLAYEEDIKPRGKREITYKLFGSTEYVLMGLEGKIIFYQKTIIAKGEIATAIFTYDDKAKDTYYPMIEPIFKSFK